jgi:preprotein translocase subunit SecF
VVVFDRTRELMRRYKTIPTVDLLNLSINSTMSRTVMTSISSALSLLALVLFGGEAIKGFAVVMLCGVLICTYSAIFISTPVLIYLGLMLSGARAASERSGVPQPAE